MAWSDLKLLEAQSENLTLSRFGWKHLGSDRRWASSTSTATRDDVENVDYGVENVDYGVENADYGVENADGNIKNVDFDKL